METEHQLEELTRQLDDKRDAYVEALRTAHAAFVAMISVSSERQERHKLSERLAGHDGKDMNHEEEVGQQAVAGAGADDGATTTNDRTNKLDPESFTCVGESLEPQHFDEEGISHYLRAMDRRARWNRPANLLRLACDGQFIPRGDDDRDTLSFCALWEVGMNGLVEDFDRDRHIRERGRSMATWKALRTSPLTMPSIAGRIVHVSGLAPRLDAALRYTMHQIFPIDGICCSLEHSNFAAATIHDAFNSDEQLRRSFHFYFRYLALVDDGYHLSSEQAFNGLVEDHIERYVSSVSLCLTGGAVCKVERMRSGGLEDGFVYDTFAPWHVLAIVQSPRATKDACRARFLECNTNARVTCGPKAFMIKVLSECERAHFSLLRLINLVGTPVTPGMNCSEPLDPAADGISLTQELMRYRVFRPELLDRFLTSDEDSQLMARRRFWACTTLDSIKSNIQTLIHNYEQAFTIEIWEGRHETFWPLADHSSRRSRHY